MKELFENIDTLKFTKEMRFFKKQWDDEKDEHKKKKIAAAMANATKSWVSDGEKMEWSMNKTKSICMYLRYFKKTQKWIQLIS